MAPPYICGFFFEELQAARQPVFSTKQCCGREMFQPCISGSLTGVKFNHLTSLQRLARMICTFSKNSSALVEDFEYFSTFLRCMFPVTRVKLLVRRGNRSSGNSENRVERRHGVKTPVESKYIFIEIGLQMFRFDTTMMRSLDPRLQIAEDEMNHR